MKPSSYYQRVADVMAELVKFTLLTRGSSDDLVDRYSERTSEGRLPAGAEHAAAAMSQERHPPLVGPA